MRRRWVNCVIVFLLVAVSFPTSHASIAAAPHLAQNWQIVGQIGGPANTIAVQGAYAYVGVGFRLEVVSISSPVTPEEVGVSLPFPHYVESVTVSGTLAYVAAGGAGLRIVDISDPTNPVEIGAWDSPGYAEGVAVSGDFAYLADGPYGLWIVEVSDSADPTPVSAAFKMNYAFDVTVSGDHAYIAAAGAGLLVADVSNPFAPLEVGSLDTPGYTWDVAIRGTVAYLADGWEGLVLADISTPGSPVKLSSIQTPGWAFGVAISELKVLVADAFRGLQVVDAADPTNLRLLGGSYGTSSHAASVAVSGVHAFIADRAWGLLSFDVSDASSPAQVGAVTWPSEVWDVLVNGDVAYLAAGINGLFTVDLSDPARPRLLDSHYMDEFAYKVDYQDGYFFGTAMPAFGDSRLQILDARNPANLVMVGAALPTPSEGWAIDVDGPVAYLDDDRKLIIMDISDPSQPQKVGQLVDDQEVFELGASGSMVCLAIAWNGLKLVDASDPTNPVVIGAWDNGESYGRDCVIQGSAAYLADHFGLQIIDIRDPAHPVKLGFYDSPVSAIGVTVSGTLAYVADGPGGVHVVDISNPYSPALAGYYDTPGFAHMAVPIGNRIAVADVMGGLIILQPVSGAAAPSPHQVPPSSDPPPAFVPRGLAELDTQYMGASTQPIRPAATPAPHSPLPARSPSGQCLVSSFADSGPGTLRACLESAIHGDTIRFDPAVFPPTNPVTISITSPLPWLSLGGLTIDASDAGVILDGSATPEGTCGLMINSSDNVVRGLQILYFPGDGVRIADPSVGNRIGGSRALGSAPLGQGNLISGNGWSGVVVYGVGTEDNIISGNFIGTDLTGSYAIPNGRGVNVDTFAENNLVGGDTPAESNVISGNLTDGVGLGSQNNRLTGNYIGVDASGTTRLGNGGAGVHMGGMNNQVGGSEPGERNVISANAVGIHLTQHDTNGNRIIGNYVGSDAVGSADLGNAVAGIALELGVYDTLIQDNLVGGSGVYGIMLSDWLTSFNILWGNYAGTNAAGNGPIPNPTQSIFMGHGTFYNLVGGTESGQGNLVSGNGGGPVIYGPCLNCAIIIGNRIGTDATGMYALGNQNAGLLSGMRTFLGGATPAEGNLISANSWTIGSSGMIINGEYDVVMGNWVGLASDGVSPLGNRGSGLGVGLAKHNWIQGNWIAHNGAGVSIEQTGSITLRRNIIYNHEGKGIILSPLASQQIPAPTITAITPTGIAGMTCSSCAVEIYSDYEDEGQFYEGSTIADAMGVFSFNTEVVLNGPFITATTTDLNGNTSEFSIPRKVSTWLYLPVIARAH
jgi:hypothetical protein